MSLTPDAARRLSVDLDGWLATVEDVLETLHHATEAASPSMLRQTALHLDEGLRSSMEGWRKALDDHPS